MNNETQQLNRELNLNALENSLMELIEMRRQEKSNLTRAKGSSRVTIEKFLLNLDGLIEKTEHKIRALVTH